jgi:transcriptional regulator with XRE-family HTH domain
LQPIDAERVKEWRHRRMLSQQEVADRAGTSLFTIQRIERGEGNVRPKTGRGVAAALGVPIEELLPKAQAPPSPTQPPLNGFEEERPSRFSEAIIAAAASWGKAMANPDMSDRKRVGLIDAALTLSDVINERVEAEDWEAVPIIERLEIIHTMGKLGEAAEQGLRHLKESGEAKDQEEQVKQRREQIRQWTDQISA